MSRSSSRRIPALLAITLATTSLPALATPASAATTSLADVQVTSAQNGDPTVQYTAPLALNANAKRVVVAGTGAPARAGERLTVDFLLLDGRTGQKLNDSFGTSQHPTLVLDPKTSIKGLVTSLTGTTAGSRVVIALAPSEGIAKNVHAPGVKKSDTLLFVMDVLQVHPLLSSATGTPVPPRAGFPAVNFDSSGKPSIGKPTGAPPTTVQVEPLVAGTGPAVTAGQMIKINYAGIVWASGRQFESSWARGKPGTFEIGTGQALQGWDEGLVGQAVGSRVLLVVPPFEGYGAPGQPHLGIGSNDTLVFVIDILDAY